MLVSRRKFILGSAALVAAPAIVRASSLMPVRQITGLPKSASIGYFIDPGSGLIVASNTLPRGWIHCDGRELSKADYAFLHSVVKDAYGRSETGFRVPDLRAYFPTC